MKKILFSGFLALSSYVFGQVQESNILIDVRADFLPIKPLYSPAFDRVYAHQSTYIAGVMPSIKLGYRLKSNLEVGLILGISQENWNTSEENPVGNFQTQTVISNANGNRDTTLIMGFVSHKQGQSYKATFARFSGYAQYNFLNTKRIDAYIGACAGFTSGRSVMWDYSYDIMESPGQTTHYNYSSMINDFETLLPPKLLYRANLGARFFLTSRLGLNAEVGYGNGGRLASAGLSLRLGQSAL